MIRVFYLAFGHLSKTFSDALGILSAEEQSRAQRMHLPNARRQFVLCRLVLRIELAKHLNCRPADVPLKLSPAGKPYIPSDAEHIAFSIAHSKDMGIVALGKVRSLGVDIEAHRPLRFRSGLVERLLNENEQKVFSNVRPELQDDIFFRAWVRKEALSKAEGTSIASGAKRWTVLGTQRIGKAKAIQLCDEVENYKVWPLYPAAGYEAALVVDGTLEQEFKPAFWFGDVT